MHRARNILIRIIRHLQLAQIPALILLSICSWTTAAVATESAQHMAFIDQHIASHEGQSGIYVLDTGEEALLARAWLADHAQHSIEVQYFIWSTDNIGILASEALLRAAERGVMVRVLVDDLLVDAPDKSLLALARHPNIQIKIYNPKNSVGVPIQKRLLNVVTNFRGLNQRMHNKTFIVDGKIAITGGRNMAAEYFDYNHKYNFRDRDVLLLGPVAESVQTGFEDFWANELSASVESLYDGLGLMQKNVQVDDEQIQQVYRELHAYANSAGNFEPEVRSAIQAVPESFGRLAAQMIWDEVHFITDSPGKNNWKFSLGGGGQTSSALAQLVESAQQRIVIQSPYLVMSARAQKLFRQTTARGVQIRVSTNSLASTDNIAAFSGYRNQRKRLLKMGVDVFEYRPDPQNQQELMHRYGESRDKAPIFALHAKTMVVDSHTVYIGSFNLDPRSENLNTEVGIVVRNRALARAVEAAIEADMQPGNSWNAATDKPDKNVSLWKRSKVRFWQFMPLKPLL